MVRTEARQITSGRAKAAVKTGPPHTGLSSRFLELVTALVLAGVVALIWCANNDRLSLKTWAVPVDYLEDCPLFFGQLQAAAEGDFTLFHVREVHRLGAPYAANWSDWPSPGKELVIFYGLLSRWIGLFAAANLSVLVAYITSALAFYAVCRLMRFRREWSFMGAVLFAFAYIHAYRNLHHIVHTYSYAVPFVLLSCWLVAFSRQMEWRSWGPWVCLGTALAVGISNPYNANMFGQLICIGLVIQFLTQRRKLNLVLGAACLGTLVLAFLAAYIDTKMYAWQNGPNFDCLSRGYYETELFGLKPTELFLPPLTHRIQALSELASSYARDEWYFKGEAFSPYLGWVGIGALVWMVAEAVVRWARPRSFSRRFPAYLPLLLWVLFYSMIGGLNSLTGFLGKEFLGLPPLFRGSNRYSIYILALALLFLVSRLTAITRARSWPGPLCFVLAGGLLVVGVFDQLPRPTPPEQTAYTAELVETDRAFGHDIEAKLQKGAMVFQLPVMAFPEGAPAGAVQSYEMLRPYISTTSLRFSFGSDKGRQREDWMKDVEHLPAAQMISTLENYGFSAIYLNRKGFPDKGQGLLDQFTAAGRADRIESKDPDHEQVCVLLHPSATAALPPESNRALWRPTGSWKDDRGGLWAHESAGLKFYSPPKLGNCSYNLVCQLGSVRDRPMTVELNGREIVWTGTIPARGHVPISQRIDAKPGYNYIAFKTDQSELEKPSKQIEYPFGYVLLGVQITRAD